MFRPVPLSSQADGPVSPAYHATSCRAAKGRAYGSNAEAAKQPHGGFRGGLWDEGWDVEYTFYGLDVLGLLA
jgi:hypothetical protein